MVNFKLLYTLVFLKSRLIRYVPYVLDPVVKELKSAQGYINPSTYELACLITGREYEKKIVKESNVGDSMWKGFIDSQEVKREISKISHSKFK